MRTGICDDNVIWNKKARELIADYGVKTDTDIEILTFTGKKELEEYRGKPVDVLFISIELEQGTGIQLAAWVNQRWKNCQIVYLSDNLACATEVYHTAHTFFALKEQFPRRIGEVFGRVFQNMEHSGSRLVFRVIGQGEVSLRPEDILYFERRGRITAVVTVWGTYEIWEKLSCVMEKLPPLDFARCHNSYIVHFPAVRERKKNAFILENNTKILISRSYSRDVRNSFLRWAMSQEKGA